MPRLLLEVTLERAPACVPWGMSHLHLEQARVCRQCWADLDSEAPIEDKEAPPLLKLGD